MEAMRLPLREKADGKIIQSHPDEAHVPIMVSDNFGTTSRIIVMFGEPIQDFGVWAYRIISNEQINKGCAVDFARAILGEKDNRTDNALVLANTGQLLWNCASARAVTSVTWASLPRPAGNWGPPAMSWRTKIPGNEGWREHIQHIFNKVLRPCLHEKTRIDIIGISEGGLGAIEYLEANCKCQISVKKASSYRLIHANQQSQGRAGVSISLASAWAILSKVLPMMSI